MMRPMRELLDGAQKGGYAVGAFNVYNYETILGVVKAAQAEKVEAVGLVTQVARKYIGIFRG